MFIHVHRNKGMGHIIQAAGWLYAFKVLTVIGESYIVDLRCYHLSACPLTSCHDCCRNYINQCILSTTQLFSDSLKILCLTHTNYNSYYIRLFLPSYLDLIQSRQLCTTHSAVLYIYPGNSSTVSHEGRLQLVQFSQLIYSGLCNGDYALSPVI